MLMQALPIAKLVDELSRLPGIGRKSALRLAYHIISLNTVDVERLAEAIIEVKRSIKTCEVCQNLTDEELCVICSDSKRERDKICVVETPKDLVAIEKGGSYKGLYHVLHGALSPMNGIGPEHIKLAELEKRLDDSISEVIIATNLSVEGDATATYISSLVKEKNIKVSRIAHGVPIGCDLEYFDSITLKAAMDNRIEF